MNNKAKTIRYLLAIVLVMGSASFASVPFYNWFCRVTGYGGTTAAVTTDSDIILNQKINVRFETAGGRKSVLIVSYDCLRV